MCSYKFFAVHVEKRGINDMCPRFRFSRIAVKQKLVLMSYATYFLGVKSYFQPLSEVFIISNP